MLVLEAHCIELCALFCTGSKHNRILQRLQRGLWAFASSTQLSMHVRAQPPCHGAPLPHQFPSLPQSLGNLAMFGVYHITKEAIAHQRVRRGLRSGCMAPACIGQDPCVVAHS